MPGRKTHMMVGSAVALGVGGLLIRERKRKGKPYTQKQLGLALLALGLGGAAGGMLPDLLEPATSPNHRQIFHSLLVFGLSATAARRLWDALVEEDPSSAEGFLLLFVVGLFSLGVLSGYASHLAADSLTPKGLPILGAG